MSSTLTLSLSFSPTLFRFIYVYGFASHIDVWFTSISIFGVQTACGIISSLSPAISPSFSVYSITFLRFGVGFGGCFDRLIIYSLSQYFIGVWCVFSWEFSVCLDIDNSSARELDGGCEWLRVRH